MSYNKCNLENVHHILIGYNQYHDYVINREIIRSNFSEGGKVWSDCWVSGEDSGGNNCPQIVVLPEESLPTPALLSTILVGLSAALIAKRDD